MSEVLPYWSVLAIINIAFYLVGLSMVAAYIEDRNSRYPSGSGGFRLIMSIAFFMIAGFTTYQWFVTGAAFKAGL